MTTEHPAMTMSPLLLVRQSRRAVFRALTADRAAIMFVRSGTKRIRAGGNGVDLKTGSLGVISPRVPLTIENQPPPGGIYAANALVVDDRILDGLRRDDLPDGDPFRATAHDRTIEAFERASACVEDALTPDRLREHALREVILWLCEDGIGFGPRLAPSFVDRLRGLISAEPDAAWLAIDAARALGVSEATFRRRLAAEGTTFGDVLMDARVTFALGMIQTTDLPINRIALDVGYASPSRFAVRFRERFGISPSHVRQADVNERIDRIGTA